MKITEVLASNIRALREHRGLTLEELGKMIGVSKQAIWNIENQQSWITLDKIEKLAMFFGIEQHELFSATNLKKQFKK